MFNRTKVDFKWQYQIQPSITLGASAPGPQEWAPVLEQWNEHMYASSKDLGGKSGQCQVFFSEVRHQR